MRAWLSRVWQDWQPGEAAATGGAKAPAAEPPLRLLILSDAQGATQTISFLRPLAPLVAEGGARVELIDETALAKVGPDALLRRWEGFRPTALVLSRYAGGLEGPVVAAARRDRLPVIYHIDDNLLAVPEALGPEKFARYNDPRRVAALEGAMRSADFIYASTTELARQLRERLPGAKVVAGDIYCAHAAVVGGPSAGRGPMTVGYMGTSGHVRDLDMVVPAMTRLLERHSDLRFETFGTIKMPAALTRFGERVAHHAGLADYDAFMRRLASLGWHIGLAPIIDSPFNRCKADTKWVEYTAAGIAVAASDLPVYSRACGDGAGLLVAPDGWTAAVQSLVESEARRHALVASAQARLSRQYSPERLRQQVLGLLAGERMSEAAT